MKGALKLLFIVALLFTGCRHKEFCEFHPHEVAIRVVFDWMDAPEANPKGMCVYFYPVDGGVSTRFDFNNRDGGTVHLRVGEYRILCFNNDTEAIHFYNDDYFDSHGVFTRAGHVLEPLYGNLASYDQNVSNTSGERVVITPDMIWGCSAVDVRIEDTQVRYSNVSPNPLSRHGYPVVSNDQIITLYPHEMVCTYTYEVRNVKNLKHLAKISGTLSGMSGRMTLSTEELDRECVTLPFEAHSDGVSKVTGKFYTFGHHADNSDPHNMCFYVVMDDGAKFYFAGGDNLNVTKQVHEAPDYRHVHLIIDGLELPQAIENGNGYNPIVDDWEEVKQDIVM